jgi:hypothetical protein
LQKEHRLALWSSYFSRWGHCGKTLLPRFTKKLAGVNLRWLFTERRIIRRLLGLPWKLPNQMMSAASMKVFISSLEPGWAHLSLQPVKRGNSLGLVY